MDDTAFKKVFRDRIFDNILTTLMQKVPRWTSLAAIGDEPGFEGSVILDRSTGSLCYHNGLTWVCVDSLTTVDIFNACASGVSLVIDGSGPDFILAGLLAGTGIALASGPCITISTVSNLTNACSTGVSLVIDGSGPDFSIAGLLAGTGITLGTGPCVTINSFVNLVDNCPNLGNISKSIVLDGSGPDLLVRGLTSGTGIMLLNDSSCIIVCATGATEAIMLQDACDTGVSLITDGSGPIMLLKNLIAGTAIALSDDGSCITISSTGDNISLSNACASGVSLVVDGSGPDLSTAGLIAGTGVSIGTDGTCVTISSTGDNISLLDACPATSPPSGVSLVVDGSGPELVIAGLRAGTGVDLASDGSCITISALGDVVTLSNACPPGSGVSLVNDGSGPDLAILGLTAGTGVSLGSDGSCVTISAPAALVTTLGNACPPGSGVSLVNDGTGPDLAVLGLSAGTGVSLGSDGSCVTISCTGDNISLGNACPPGSGVSLVNDGTGPDLAVLGLIGGSGISLSSDGSCVTIEADTAPPVASQFMMISDGSVVSIAGGVTLTVTYGNSLVNVGGDMSPVTGTYTAPVTGVYTFEGGAVFSYTAALSLAFNMDINVNAAQYVSTSHRDPSGALAGATQWTRMNVSSVASLTAGDTVTLVLFNSPGNPTVTLSVSGTAADLYFHGHMIA